MKALSIKQPWAWLIISGRKDIENRPWESKHRGPFLVHASSSIDMKAYQMLVAQGHQIPNYKMMAKGGIVGVVEMVDCVTNSRSPWFQGPYGFVLQNARPVGFHECKGALKFFEVNYNPEESVEMAQSKEPPKEKKPYNLFSFVRSSKESPFSKTGRLFVACVLALDGTVLHECEAMSEDEAKQLTGIKDAHLDDLFNKHYPQGWRIKWVNCVGAKGDSADPEFRVALEALKAKRKPGNGAQASQPASPAKAADQPGNSSTSQPKAENKPAEPAKQGQQEAQTPQGAAIEASDGPAQAPGIPADAQAEGVGSKVETEKPTYFSLAVHLSDAEKAELAEKLLDLLYDRNRIEGEKKAAMDGFKAELSDVEESINKILEQRRKGRKTSVPCLPVIDTATGEVLYWTRQDTKESVTVDEAGDPVMGLGHPDEGGADKTEGGDNGGGAGLHGQDNGAADIEGSQVEVNDQSGGECGAGEASAGGVSPAEPATTEQPEPGADAGEGVS